MPVQDDAQLGTLDEFLPRVRAEDARPVDQDDPLEVAADAHVEECGDTFLDLGASAPSSADDGQ
jgi:hypothetical protein